jgi:hypothetical protein
LPSCEHGSRSGRSRPTPCGRQPPVADTVRLVLAELATVNGNGNGGHPPNPAPDVLLTVHEAAARLPVAPRWLYRHALALPFARHLGPRTLRFEAAGLATWVARR